MADCMCPLSPSEAGKRPLGQGSHTPSSEVTAEGPIPPSLRAMVMRERSCTSLSGPTSLGSWLSSHLRAVSSPQTASPAVGTNTPPCSVASSSSSPAPMLEGRLAGDGGAAGATSSLQPSGRPPSSSRCSHWATSSGARRL
ncbi:mCG148008 [Mus musculus]|nr:mCG148008 [Mus musculus]